jgi:hypothetical protein
MAALLLPLTLQTVNLGMYAVQDASGQHVGNLKRIGSVWKFKAVGYTASSELIPGGGPLTHWHNTELAQADLAELHSHLLANGP